MSRLLTVVNERKVLRDKYRRHLEEQYINEKKEEEIKERLLAVRNLIVKFLVLADYRLPMNPFWLNATCIERQNS